MTYVDNGYYMAHDVKNDKFVKMGRVKLTEDEDEKDGIRAIEDGGVIFLSPADIGKRVGSDHLTQVIPQDMRRFTYSRVWGNTLCLCKAEDILERCGHKFWNRKDITDLLKSDLRTAFNPMTVESVKKGKRKRGAEEVSTRERQAEDEERRDRDRDRRTKKRRRRMESDEERWTGEEGNGNGNPNEKSLGKEEEGERKKERDIQRKKGNEEKDNKENKKDGYRDTKHRVNMKRKENDDLRSKNDRLMQLIVEYGDELKEIGDEMRILSLSHLNKGAGV